MACLLTPHVFDETPQLVYKTSRGDGRNERVTTQGETQGVHYPRRPPAPSHQRNAGGRSPLLLRDLGRTSVWTLQGTADLAVGRGPAALGNDLAVPNGMCNVSVRCPRTPLPMCPTEPHPRALVTTAGWDKHWMVTGVTSGAEEGEEAGVQTREDRGLPGDVLASREQEVFRRQSDIVLCPQICRLRRTHHAGT